MSRLPLALIAAVSAIAFMQIASAADLPRKAPAFTPPPPPPVYDWTGFYVGGNVGWLGERDSSTTTNFVQPPPNGLGANPQSIDTSAGSFVGGVQVGYNWQFDQHWMLGVEGDWVGTNLSSSFCRQTDLVSAACFDNARGFLTMNEKTNWLTSARARLGWTWNNWLFYGTGGGGWGEVNTGITVSCAAGCGFSPGANHTTNTFRNTASGWVAGLGVEAMFWGNWTGSVEWLHYGLGAVTNSITVPAASPFTVSWARNLNYDTVRFKLNYRFNWWK